MNDSRAMNLGGSADNQGHCIIYFMSRDQRVADNHVLLTAQSAALKARLPLVVAFNLLPNSRYRSREHFEFMLDGLEEVAGDLARLNISFVLNYGPAIENSLKLITEVKPLYVYFDFNPLRGVRQWHKLVAEKSGLRCEVVDTHNIVPLWVTSDKEEYAAHTFRPKIHRHLEHYLVPPGELKKHPYKYESPLGSIDFKEARSSINSLPASGIKPAIRSGPKAATKTLQDFIDHRLDDYAAQRNDPTQEGQSGLSPYLHFGQISALRVALDILENSLQPPLLFRQAKLASYAGQPDKMDSINAFLEELIIRKELADNFCFYNGNYDRLTGARDWARQTLAEHRSDQRPHVYSLDQLEDSQTHDQAWNAAQQQMVSTGKMHGYMRMYWAKKILEWTADPEEAVQRAVQLNDKYSLDGGDPNGYTGIMWSIAGVHDRPWFERPVFGKIRYMNNKGLKRRFGVDKYINQCLN